MKGWEHGEGSVSGFEVEPGMLQEHANHIDDIVDEFSSAADAMKAVSGADNAYGVLCEWMTPILAERSAEQSRILDKLANNLREIADAVREAAREYDASDEDSKLMFDSFEEA